MMKIKIISDGNPVFTRVINSETGENLPVVAARWEMDIRQRPHPGMCQAWVLLDGVEIEADGLKVVFPPPKELNPIEVTAVGTSPFIDFTDEEE